MRRRNKIAVLRPFQQIVGKNAIELGTVTESEARPQAGRFGAAVKKRVDVEQVGLCVIGNETERFEFVIGDANEIPVGRDHFNVRIEKARRRIDDAFCGLSVKAIDEDSLRGAGGQGTNQISILFQTNPPILYH